MADADAVDRRKQGKSIHRDNCAMLISHEILMCAGAITHYTLAARYNESIAYACVGHRCTHSAAKFNCSNEW